MLMPFGRYKGQELSVLPAEYLQWLAGIELREPLAGAVLAEVERRNEGGAAIAIASSSSSPQKPRTASSHSSKQKRKSDGEGAWTVGGGPQEIIAGDFPVSSRRR